MFNYNKRIGIALSAYVDKENKWIEERVYKTFKYYLQCNISKCSIASNINVVNNDVISCYMNEEFSISKFKNKAAIQLDTEYILLTDPDFITFDDFLYKMVNFADIMKSHNLNNFFIFPAYYANQKQSSIICQLPFEKYNEFLHNFFYMASISGISSYCDFIAPYSNNLFFSRDFFQLSGGYNENFFGYGSEDFEFIIRCLLILNFFPLPNKLWKDDGKPQVSFFPKNYSGFRRLLELYSLPLELCGFRFMHIFHNKFSNLWYKKRDRFRLNFEKFVIPIINNNKLILKYDWIPRSKQIICIISDETRWRDFLMLRLEGYKIILYEGKINFDDILYFIQDKNIYNIAFTEDFSSDSQKKHIIFKLRDRQVYVKILKKIIYQSNYDNFSYVSQKIDISRHTINSYQRIPKEYNQITNNINKYVNKLKFQIKEKFL